MRFKKPTQTMSILFPAGRYTGHQARAWLKKHKKKAPRMDRTKGFLRYRQKALSAFDKETIRTIPMGRTGIKAVIGVPKKTRKRSNPMEIVAINPRRKRRAAPMKRRSKPKTKTTKRRVTTMPKRRRKRRAAPKTRTRTRTKTVVRYRTRRAPKRRRRRNPGRAGSFARATIAGVNIPGALKNALPMFLGALAGKAAAKKFADGGAETDNWTWANYLWCLGGGLIAALGTSAIFKGGRATSQRIFEGALLLTGYKFFTNDVAPRNTTLESWFGQDDAREAALIESAAQAIDPYGGIFGEITEAPEGDFQMLGEHYVPASVLGQAVEPATARLGQMLEPATRRLGQDPTTRFFDEAYGR